MSAEAAPPERSRLELPLHAESRGSGPPLLLIHGFGANAYTWRHWVAELARDHEVVQVDLKGFGSAPKPRDGAYAAADQAALLHRLVLQRDLRDLTLVGHSLGGGISLLLALRLLDTDPGRLRGLVLVAAAAYRQEMPTYVRLAQMPWVGELLLRVLPARYIVRKVLESIVYDPDTVTVGQVDAYAAPLTESGGRRALAETARQIEPRDLEEVVRRYPEIDRPALLLWGRHDPIVPVEIGERLAADLPRARLEVMEECGHDPPEELPRASLEIVLEFLGELYGRDPGGL